MRFVNVSLCFVVSALLVLAVFEVGLRVLGRGPQPTINRFDPVTGWSKKPNTIGTRQTSEFDVRYEINALGLRDDPMTSPKKPDGKSRVLMLGDSFVLGYTVNRTDLFVDVLEDWWRAEGRNVDVVNAGTEGWSTDQEVAWFEANGAAFEPDVVVLFPYQNDLYWAGQTHYRRFPKPRFTAFGNLEHVVLQDPGPKPWYESTALGTTWASLHEPHVTWSPDGVRYLEMETAAYFKAPPTEFMPDAIARTRGALVALKADCQKIGARLYVAPIPERVCVESTGRASLSRVVNRLPPGRLLKFWDKPAPLDPASWSPDQPMEVFLALARELDIPAFDARAALRAEAAQGPPLYFRSDFHLNPHGNRALARFLHEEFERAAVFPAQHALVRAVAMPEEPVTSRLPGWLPWYAGLWLALSTLYAFTYRGDPYWKAALGVAVMLGLVFGIAIGGGALLEIVPAGLAPILTLAVVATILSFVVYKLGARMATIVELLGAFTRRGHWYLMPLVVILLSVGSLLVVAASSPLIAPFIYTLF